ncbi:tumor necrosis factor receptor superfamily member 1B isoform X1 [Pogona vitticeps]
MRRCLRRPSERLFLCSALQLVAAQVLSLPYTPQLPEKCQNPNLEHYVEAINKCCSSCPPGSRVLRSCNETVDTQCVPCEEGTYTLVWSRAERCLGCDPPCRAGFVEVTACKATQNRHCWCQPHQFCSQRISKGVCLRCEALPLCQRGYGVVRPGTKTRDLECAPCRPGTFSDVESPTEECKPHTICKSILIPGNSTSDNVCREPRGPNGGGTISPHTTARGSGPSPTQHSVTEDLTLPVKKDPPGDVSSAAGWAAGAMFALFALISGTLLCFAFHNKSQPCASLCRNEKQPFPPAEKLPGSCPQDGNSQEEQNLLETSASSSSGSLDQASEKSSRISKMEADGLQQRLPLLNNSVTHSTADSKQSSSGKTHVNVSCVVSLCNLDHSVPFQSLNGSIPAVPRGCSSAEDKLPLSKEESTVKKEPGRQIAVEVEDNMEILDFQERKLLPLSTQDAGMKIS